MYLLLEVLVYLVWAQLIFTEVWFCNTEVDWNLMSQIYSLQQINCL